MMRISFKKFIINDENFIKKFIKNDENFIKNILLKYTNANWALKEQSTIFISNKCIGAFFSVYC
jgi:hypothetical protein